MLTYLLHVFTEGTMNDIIQAVTCSAFPYCSSFWFSSGSGIGVTTGFSTTLQA